MQSNSRPFQGAADEPRVVEGHALVAAVLDRYVPVAGDWDAPSLEDAERDEVAQIRRYGRKVRSQVELSVDGMVIAGAGTVLAARRMGLKVVPAKWTTANEQVGAPLDPYWVMFQHRLGSVGDRAVCRCAYAYPLRVKSPQESLHPQHLADVLWVADLLAPVLNVKGKVADLLHDHQPKRVSVHGVMVDQCLCGAKFDPDNEPGAWIQHRVDRLTEAGLVLSQRMRDLLR